MDKFYWEKGVFIHSEVLDTKCMIDCLQSLAASCPGIKITSVVSDDMNSGYKVYFEDFEMRNVLVKRFIKVADKQMRMYPLTTCLLIPDVHRTVNSNFEYELSTAFKENYGKVLHIEVLENTASHLAEKSAKTNSFLFQIDVPELKDLSIFKKNGYPGMFIRVPNVFKTYPVKFWCTLCRKDGHTYQECFDRPPRPDTSQEENAELMDVDRHARSCVPGFTEVNDGPYTFKEKREAPTPPFTSENIISHDADSGKSRKEINVNAQNAQLVSNYGVAAGSNALEDHRHIILPVTNCPLRQSSEGETILSNVADSPMSEMNGEEQNAQSKKEEFPLNMCSISFDIPPVKAEIEDGKEGSIVNTKVQNDENSMTYLPVATSTTADDDVQIIEDESNYENSYDYARSTLQESGNDTSDSMFKEKPRDPAGGEENSKALAGKSYKQQVGDTSVLSDDLKRCIDESCSVLDRETLKSFFFHVRKKSNPKNIAAVYTENLSGLKEQLMEIKRLYFNLQQLVRTKEDTAFIKWLSGLIERYDETGGKRKCLNGGGGTPNKKNDLDVSLTS